MTENIKKELIEVIKVKDKYANNLLAVSQANQQQEKLISY